MHELILYKNERKIMSPYCEITFKLENNATIEDLIESFEYWGVKYKDMNAEYSGTMEKLKQKIKEVRAEIDS